MAKKKKHIDKRKTAIRVFAILMSILMLGLTIISSYYMIAS